MLLHFSIFVLNRKEKKNNKKIDQKKKTKQNNRKQNEPKKQEWSRELACWDGEKTTGVRGGRVNTERKDGGGEGVILIRQMCAKQLSPLLEHHMQCFPIPGCLCCPVSTHSSGTAQSNANKSFLELSIQPRVKRQAFHSKYFPPSPSTLNLFSFSSWFWLDVNNERKQKEEEQI